MAIRSMLLPAVTLALPFLVNACGNEPTSPLNRTRGPHASASVFGPGPAPLKLYPVAGNFTPPDFKFTGNATYSQAQWTNKVWLDGKFSVLLEKSLDFASCYTPEPENGCAAFAAAIVNGVEGMTITQLGTIGFSVSGGTCGAGAPRFNLYYDTNSDGEADGVAFYGCGNHVSGTPGTGWTSMSASSATPDFCYSFPAGACTLTVASTVVQLSVLVDEMGTWYIDRVGAAGYITGEPNGS